MKNLLFILFFIISDSASAQMEKNFTSTDSSDISRLINLVLKNAKSKYLLNNSNNNNENAIEVIYSDGKNKLIFEFSRINSLTGEHSNTSGAIQYTFVSVTGPYKDLFPFWKLYFQPGDKMKVTAKNNHGTPAKISYRDGEMISTFNKYGDNWEIENRYPRHK